MAIRQTFIQVWVKGGSLLDIYLSMNELSEYKNIAVTVKRIWALPLLLVALIAIAFLLGQRFDDNALQHRELTIRKRVGYPEINDRLYALSSAGQLSGAIAGNYMFMSSLPELKQRFYYDEVSNERDLLKTIRLVKANYLITMPTSQQKTIDRVVAAVGDQIPLRLVFSENGFSLYEIMSK